MDTMTYGHFDNQLREYVITNPMTPVRWINYIGTLNFGGFIDHVGGSLLCRGDPALNRITKYIPQLPASSFNGETLYLRTKKKSGYRLYSPYFVPTLDPLEVYECHVGLGYTQIVSEVDGLRTEVTIFVPIGETCALRDIRITNTSNSPLEVDVIPVVEYTHPDALKQFTNADWVPQTMQSEAVEDGTHLILMQYPFMFRENKVNYFTSDAPASSFETDRRIFLGEHEYRTWSNPLSLENPELNNSVALRGDNIAALMHHLGSLKPGESRRMITQLGQAESMAASRHSIERYRNQDNVDNAFKSLADSWETYLSRFQVETPDDDMDTMLNVHNPRQCFTTLNWSRYVSLYQLGLGARGIGFRDSSQDVLGIMVLAPDEGKQLIRQLLHVQKRDGSAMHQYNPLTMVANEGDARHVEDAPKYYSDDHLWIILAITAYLKETGDFSFLDEQIAFYEKDSALAPLESGTVFEHMIRALEFTRNDTGAHGLPRLGFADWNDTVNLRTGAESVFAAQLYGKALLEMIELSQALQDVGPVETYALYHNEMRQKVNEHSWDGEWYLRYFDADGTRLGSKSNTQGQIYTNAQSWSVISGYAPQERACAALEAVFTRLNTRCGIKLSAPGYDGYDPNKGGITTYPPGAKENGGIFLHANPWVIIAETMLGNGDRAYEYYRQMNPVAKNNHIDEFECEPYVYPQNILGDEHPQFGLARNSWLTGTASWAWQAATMYILGIMPTYQGLKLDPCIPHHWDGFNLRRYFRQAWYDIEVRNPEHVCRGIKSIFVDDEPLEGNILPIFRDGQTHRVSVTLGS